jgi:predicted nucleic acid-binding protein
MILVDTSIWIDLLSGRGGLKVSEDDLLLFATCGPVVQEVTQGLKHSKEGDAFYRYFGAVPVLSDPVPLSLFYEASDIYRSGRRKGYTIRSSTDCLIAAIAIANRVPVWHRDRDFASIARFTRLEVR